VLVIFEPSGGPPDDLGVAVTRVSVEFASVDAGDGVGGQADAVVIGPDRQMVERLATVLEEMSLSVERVETLGQLARASRARARLVVADLRDGQASDADYMRALRAMGGGALIAIVKPDEQAVARCLDGDADDCITRPIHVAEFRARVARRLRALDPRPGASDFGWITVDHVGRHITVEGEVVDLTAREFDLVAFLSRFPKTVFSRDELLQRVWGSSKGWQSPRTVTEHVYRVRRKIAGLSDRDPLVTVPGAGYRFDP